MPTMGAQGSSFAPATLASRELNYVGLRGFGIEMKSNEPL